MRVFLVERYVPSVERSELTSASTRLSDVCGGDVRHVTTLVIETDETCLSLIEAPDAAAVECLNERAGFPFDRIVEVARL